MNDYGQFTREHLKKMSKGLKLFNSGHYWECHEELEDLWLNDAGDNSRYVYWAILQAATALFHYSDGNLEGAKGQIRRAKEKLAKCESLHVETDLLYNNLSWREFKDLVMNIPMSPKLSDFESLSQFRFKVERIL